MKNPFLKSAKSIFIVLCITFLLIEVFFQLGHILVTNTEDRSSDYNLTNTNTSIRILSEGDSHTFGIGSGAGNKGGYPAQLQEILNNNFKEKDFIVFNRGIPGSTSDEILDRLKVEINELNPHIILLLMGVNNGSKVTDKMIQAAKSSNLWIKTILFLKNKSRLIKFIYLIKEQYNKHNGTPKFPNEIKIKQIETNPDINALFDKANQLVQINDYEGALKLLYECNRLSPNNTVLVIRIIQTINGYIQDIKSENNNRSISAASLEAKHLYWLKYLINIDPDSAEVLTMVTTYYFIEYHGEPIHEIESYLINSKIFDDIMKNLKRSYMKRTGEKYKGDLLRLNKIEGVARKNKIKSDIIADYISVINLAKKNNIKLFLLTYPFEDLYEDRLIRIIARTNNISLIDTQQLLRKASENVEVFMSWDYDHPNKNGYKIIAEGCAKKIIEYFYEFDISIKYSTPIV